MYYGQTSQQVPKVEANELLLRFLNQDPCIIRNLDISYSNIRVYSGYENSFIRVMFIKIYHNERPVIVIVYGCIKATLLKIMANDFENR